MSEQHSWLLYGLSNLIKTTWNTIKAILGMNISLALSPPNIRRCNPKVWIPGSVISFQVQVKEDDNGEKYLYRLYSGTVTCYSAQTPCPFFRALFLPLQGPAA